MLKICLVFWESEPQYAYKHYAYKKNMYQIILSISHFSHRFTGWGAAIGLAYSPGLCDTKVSINKVCCEKLISFGISMNSIRITTCFRK